jgi:hypothetical protein
VQSQRFKVLAAMVGAGAVIAMGALSLTLGQHGFGSATTVSDPTATLGETVTTTTPPSQPVTSQATPPFTFTTPSGFAVPH